VRRRYWDSAAFLALLREEAGRVDKCRAVIGEAQAGSLVIVTSTLALAEVLMLRGSQPIPKGDAEIVRRFFRNRWIVLHELDRTLAERAQDVVWDHGIAPKDAVHVATALDAGVEQLDTFDQPLIGKSGTLGDPPLRIGEPGIEGSLFDPSP
jgi:predicted nucleic acid-binding protein